jgi:hypothetical protein
MTSLLSLPSPIHLRKVTQFSLKKSLSLYIGRVTQRGLFVQTVSVDTPTDMQSCSYIIAPLCVQQGGKCHEEKYSSNNENDTWYPPGNTIINLSEPQNNNPTRQRTELYTHLTLNFLIKGKINFFLHQRLRHNEMK